MMAVAQFREVIYGQVLYGGDDLSGAEWDNRGWQSRHESPRKSLLAQCRCVLEYPIRYTQSNVKALRGVTVGQKPFYKLRVLKLLSIFSINSLTILLYLLP